MISTRETVAGAKSTRTTPSASGDTLAKSCCHWPIALSPRAETGLFTPESRALETSAGEVNSSETVSPSFERDAFAAASVRPAVGISGS